MRDEIAHIEGLCFLGWRLIPNEWKKYTLTKKNIQFQHIEYGSGGGSRFWSGGALIIMESMVFFSHFFLLVWVCVYVLCLFRSDNQKKKNELRIYVLMQRFKKNIIQGKIKTTPIISFFEMNELKKYDDS